MNEVVIWGASGHAMVVADIVRLQGLYTIAGFLDNVSPQRKGETFCGSSILGGEEQLETLLSMGINQILLGFGNCHMRLQKTPYLLSKGFSLPIAVHPKAVVASDVSLGAGTVVAAGAIINPGVRVGCSVIINTSASVDHECVIGDAAHISPGAHLAGQVVVGEATQIGIGAVVIQDTTIGSRSIVGAGAVVVQDIPDQVIAYGVPAKVKRSIE